MPRLLALVLIALLGLPAQAQAHDDPVVTIRVLCNGFNVLDMDAVLGEISDSATLKIDRTVQGSNQIQAWVKEQMDDDLRIEIVDISTPQKLPDGYTLSWSGRFSRQDWRSAGIPTREVTNNVVIHNGRITEWTAALGASAVAPLSAPVSTPEVQSGIPEVLGVPVTLLLAGAIVIGGATFFIRGVVRRR